MPEQKKSQKFFLVVNKKHVLNYEYASVVDADQIMCPSNIIWAGRDLP